MLPRCTSSSLARAARSRPCRTPHPLLWTPTTVISRSHSSGGAAPSFAPPSMGETSAGTEVPYGVEGQASAAYLPTKGFSAPRRPSSSPSSDSASAESTATTSTPDNLTPEQRRLLEEIIRVDQAGELGANLIYQGQKWGFRVRGERDTAGVVQEMWDGEKKHIAVFDKLLTQHGVRPTALYPLWKVAGFALGAGTALMGKRSAMACTEAVETVIGEHYDSQVRSLLSSLPPSHPSIPLLTSILQEFRDDELGHLETAIEHEAQQAPVHALLSALIAGGCRVAIGVSSKI